MAHGAAVDGLLALDGGQTHDAADAGCVDDHPRRGTRHVGPVAARVRVLSAAGLVRAAARHGAGYRCGRVRRKCARVRRKCARVRRKCARVRRKSARVRHSYELWFKKKNTASLQEIHSPPAAPCVRLKLIQNSSYLIVAAMM